VTTLAWWHCFSGIAGDMALGSLVDAGADLSLIERELVALPIGGWSLETHSVLRAGLTATHVDVRTQESGVVRTHSHIVGLITEARLAERVRHRALGAFAALAEAEGRLHGRPPGQVHLHEVGGVDAIIDIVGTCVALELLGVDQIHSSAVAQGHGRVRSAHGHLPVPTPAVVELLRGAPTYGTDIPHELTTPTGAALLAALVEGWGPMPAMTVQASGFGAGTRDLEGLPNVVQVVIGETVGARSLAGEPASGADFTRAGDPTGADDSGRAAGSPQGQPVFLLEANVDDVTGEVLADTIASLLAAGAYDAWVTPVMGKKGRPAHVVSALTDPVLAGQVRDLMMAETGTLGVRGQQLTRWAARRQISEVEVGGYPIRIKTSAMRVKAEHDDAARAARLLGVPVRDVIRRAEEQAHLLTADAITTDAETTPISPSEAPRRPDGDSAG
jgi:hypothetical protein